MKIIVVVVLVAYVTSQANLAIIDKYTSTIPR